MQALRRRFVCQRHVQVDMHSVHRWVGVAGGQSSLCEGMRCGEVLTKRWGTVQRLDRKLENAHEYSAGGRQYADGDGEPK